MSRRRPAFAIVKDERRVTCRYPAAREPVIIGWWVGEKFKTVGVALRDISLSGASAKTRTPPPASGPVWIRLNDPAQPEWVEAKVIAISTGFWGPSLVRMKFSDACPYDFFTAAIRGSGPSNEAEGSVRAGSHGFGHYWGGHYWD
jgi:hypothetical protein